MDTQGKRPLVGGCLGGARSRDSGSESSPGPRTPPPLSGSCDLSSQMTPAHLLPNHSHTGWGGRLLLSLCGQQTLLLLPDHLASHQALRDAPQAQGRADQVPGLRVQSGCGAHGRELGPD